MKTLILTLAAMLCVASVACADTPPTAPAPAPPAKADAKPGPGGPGPHPGGPEGGMARRLHEADTNHDGKVSFDEAKKAFPDMTKERFDLLDSNHDGSLTPEDRPAGGPGGPGGPGGGFRERMEKADANHDGKLSFDEAQKAFPEMTKERFDRMDTNHDGFVGPDDRRGGPGGGFGGGRGAGERMKEADTNKDGKVSLEEAQKVFPEMTKERFDRFDANHDGFISDEDRALRRSERGGDRPGPPPAGGAPAPAPAPATAPAAPAK